MRIRCSRHRKKLLCIIFLSFLPLCNIFFGLVICLARLRSGLVDSCGLTVWEPSDDDSLGISLEDQDPLAEIEVEGIPLRNLSAEVKEGEENTIALQKFRLWSKKKIQNRGMDKHVLLWQTGNGKNDLRHNASNKDVVIWTINDQSGQMYSLKLLLSTMGVQLHIGDPAFPCTQSEGCDRRSQLFSGSNIMDLPQSISVTFHQVYKDDPNFRRADAFLCVHPVSLCELYIPYNKTIILYIDDRYNKGRTDVSRWKLWNTRLVNRIAQESINSIMASSDYDVEYLRYFTNIEAMYVPPHCGYMVPRTKEEPVTEGALLLHPFEKRFHTQWFKRAFTNASSLHGSGVHLLSLNMQDHFAQPLMREASAVVYLPSRPASLAFVELYRSNTPIFAPSLELLTRWHHERGVVTHKSLRGGPSSQSSSGSLLPGVMPLPDPNNDIDKSHIGFWLQFADVYTFSYVQYFESVSDLVGKLSRLNKEFIEEVKHKMEKFNKRQTKVVRDQWMQLVKSIRRRRSNQTP